MLSNFFVNKVVEKYETKRKLLALENYLQEPEKEKRKRLSNADQLSLEER